MTIVKYEEQNSFADPRKANNGGGYHQPLIVCEMGTHTLVIDDTSCGDFGRRYTVRYDGIVIYERNDLRSNEIYEKKGYNALLCFISNQLGYCSQVGEE